MSEMPNQISIQGDVKGQIAVGNYINQFQNLNGCSITILSPDQRPKWERHSKPVHITPRPPRTFLDRTSEINFIEKSISSNEPMTLSGVAGIGKTTLLKQLARLVRTDPFPDGIYCFSAYDLKIDDLLQCLFSAFYESNMAVKPDRAEIQSSLQSVKALILIDDLYLTRDEIQVILDITPSCVFVITSTQQILQSDSAAIRLGGLPDNDSLTLFEQELGRSLNENEKQLACEICHLLKGHPEHIRLLAAKTREEGLALDEIISRLKDHSLEPLLQESVQCLPQIEQQILAILSAVEGRSLPQEHLDALLQSEAIKQALANLAARGLIQSHSPAYSVSESVSGILARSSDSSPWDDLVINYFVKWLEQKPAHQRVAEIQDTLLILMKKALQRKNWSAVVSLGHALEPVLILQGYWQAWDEILHFILESATSLGDRKLEGWTFHQLGSRSLCLGSKDQALDLLKRAASIRQAIGDQAGLQLTQHNLSLITGAAPLGRAAKPAATAHTTLYTMVAIGAIAVTALGVLAAVLLYRPRPPVLTQPPNEFIEIAGISPAFEWQSVRGAATYQIQVDNQPEFTSPEVDRTTTMTNDMPGVGLKQGVYYWHVRGISQFNRPGNWSETRRLTISIPPGKSILIQPADQSLETKPDALVFVWEKVDNAAYYQIQLDDNSDFGSPEYESRDTINEHSPSSPLSQGTYYWRVMAFNPFGTPGDWSDSWSFTLSIPPPVLQLIQPTDGSVLESANELGFTWQSVENASQYQMQIDDSSAFDSPLLDTPISDASFVSTTPLEQGVYYWRVQALNSYGTAGDWSEIWSFTISVPPEVPVLINPANGVVETTTRRPSFEWTDVEHATNYKIQVDNSAAFDSPEYETTDSNTSRIPAMDLPQDVYYWRVQAINHYGTPSDWSDAWSFTISIPPAVPFLVAPSNSSKIESTNRPSFSWQGVINAAQYHIQVDNSSAFNSPEYETTESNTSRTAGVGLAQGVYYWRVQAINAYETPGEWSSTWQFTMSIPPGPVVLLDPPNGSYRDYSTKIFFTWKSAANAAYYRLQVDNDPAFGSPETDGTTPNTTGGAWLLQGIYYWRVQAFNTYDTPGDWSPAWQLTAVPPVVAPNLRSPTNNAYITTYQPVFTWYSVQGANSYQIEIDDNPGFNAPEISRTTSSTQIQITSGLTPESLPQGTYYFTYYWRVKATNQYGMAGPWSSVWVVTLVVTYVD